MNYHESYGSFPPAYITNEEGKPIHSWRILVAKTLEPEKFETYRFHESWDSPHNLKLADQIPKYLQCPNDTSGDGKRLTSYVVVMGENTAFPYADSVSLTDVDDDHDTTILVVEAVDSEIFWTEPKDLHFSKLSFEMDKDKKNGLFSNDFIGPGVVTVNALTSRIPRSLSAEQRKGMFTISGNEKGVVP